MERCATGGMINSKLKIVYITDRDLVNRWVVSPNRTLSDRRCCSMFAMYWIAKPRDRINSNRDRWLSANMRDGIMDLENQLASLAPDLIVVCGAPVLRKQIYDLPNIATINVHFGISSAYRGQHGIFFPLRDRQLEKLGATAHLVDAGVNTGAVLLEYFPSIASTDHEFSLDLKMGKGIANPIVKMLEELENSDTRKLSGVPLARPGKAILFEDRNFVNSMGYAVSGLLKRRPLTTREARINQHYRIG